MPAVYGLRLGIVVWCAPAEERGGAHRARAALRRDGAGT